MKSPGLMPPFVLANGRWSLVEDWEPGREHGRTTIRPLTLEEARLFNTYLDSLMTEAWALITAPGR